MWPFKEPYHQAQTLEDIRELLLIIAADLTDSKTGTFSANLLEEFKEKRTEAHR